MKFSNTDLKVFLMPIHNHVEKNDCFAHNDREKNLFKNVHKSVRSKPKPNEIYFCLLSSSIFGIE